MNLSALIKTLILSVLLGVVAFVLSKVVFSLAQPEVAALSCFLGAFIASIIQLNMQNPAKQTLKTLYVGNLPYRANEAAVRRLFADYGFVHSVRLMKDKNTGKRRGFGFVEMNEADANNAIAALNETDFQQRTLKIREAKERPERSPVEE